MTPAPIGGSDPGFGSGPAAAAGGAGPGGTGGEDYENEPPLLEELGRRDSIVKNLEFRFCLTNGLKFHFEASGSIDDKK